MNPATAKVLSQETTALLADEVIALTEALVSISFVGPEGLVTDASKTTAMLQYVELQAKRSALLTLLQESAETLVSLQSAER